MPLATGSLMRVRIGRAGPLAEAADSGRAALPGRPFFIDLGLGQACALPSSLATASALTPALLTAASPSQPSIRVTRH